MILLPRHAVRFPAPAVCWLIWTLKSPVAVTTNVPIHSRNIERPGYAVADEMFVVVFIAGVPLTISVPAVDQYVIISRTEDAAPVNNSRPAVPVLAYVLELTKSSALTVYMPG